MSFQPATQVGTYAEHVILAAEDVVVRPDGLDPERAATLPLAGLTALQALDLLDLAPSATMFVNGVLGAVDGFAAQLAARAGARLVAAARHNEVDAARSLDADLVLDRDKSIPAQLKTVLPDGVDTSLDVSAGPLPKPPSRSPATAAAMSASFPAGGAPAAQTSTAPITRSGPRRYRSR